MMYNEMIDMPAESFHPTLVKEGYVTDDHRAYAEWARRTYRQTTDIPGIHTELRAAETAEGDKIRFYVSQPHPDLPDSSRDGLLVHRHPFGNGNVPHLRLRSQVLADVTGMRVLSFPNNIGSERFEHFSRSTRGRFKSLGFKAIAQVHAEIVENEMLGDENVYPFGWSEGGSGAAALFAVSGDRFRVPSFGAGDPPNSVARSGPFALLRDFGNETGESFISAARRADIPALSEALHLADNEASKSAGNKWVRDLALHPPLARIAMLRRGDLYDDIRSGFQAHRDAQGLVFAGEVSPVAPVDVLRTETREISIEIRHMGQSCLSLLVLEGAGHGQGDQILDLAVIADRVAAA